MMEQQAGPRIRDGARRWRNPPQTVPICCDSKQHDAAKENFSVYGVVKKNRRKTYRNVDHQTYRFTRERTSTSQSQMLWTFLVAIAVAMIGLLNMKTSATKTSQVDPLPSRQPAQVLLSPAPNKSEAPRLEDHTS